MENLTDATAGFAFGGALIVAIGAQNAYVLRQGLRREHVAVVVAICALSDILLILVGVAGMGAAIESRPTLLSTIKILGAGFLLVYAALAVRRVVRGGESLDPTQSTSVKRGAGLGVAAGTALALTWLNPHVYLDTMLLSGSIAQQYGETGRWWFGAGSSVASVAWFSLIGFGARAATPLFTKPIAWRVLDSLIAVTLVVIAVTLLRS